MEHDDGRELESLRREVALLRSRVAELQRGAARFDDLATSTTLSGLEVSISEREELLLEAERIGHVGSWFWNVETDQVLWSDELFRILGYKPGEDQATSENFFAAVHPQDHARVQEAVAHGVASGQAPQIDYRVLRRDGTVRQVSLTGAMLFDDVGKLRRVVGTVRDYTNEHRAAEKLREANARLEEAQAIGNLGSWTFDPQSGETQWSRELYRILGLSEDVKPSSDGFLDFVCDEDRERFRQAHRRVLEGAAISEAQGRIVRADGQPRYVRMRGVASFAESGTVQSIRGTVLDITEHMGMQQKLLQVHKMEAVGRLAGGIAHDFNNLLTVVSANLELLRQDLGSDNASFEDTFRALASAKSLVQRLLTFGQRAPLVRQTIDVNALVRSTLQLLLRLVGDQVALSAQLAEPLPLVDVDSVQIEQALMNLVINARDVLGPGGTIVITTQTIALDQQTWVEVAVADNGPGIAENMRAQIFEPFFTTKAERGGSGLGLSMVLGTAQQHGGTVTVEPGTPTGTVFRMRLPANVTRAATLTDRKPRTRHFVKDQPRTVLLIEDEPMIASVLKRGLGRRGHTVLVAEHANDARALWIKHQAEVDVIVCDMVMPQMRGPDLIREFSIAKDGPKVVFITGYSKEMAATSLEHPVLTKPFSVDDLHAMIEQLMVSAYAASDDEQERSTRVSA